jgi:methionyl-tRNA formyltransferase
MRGIHIFLNGKRGVPVVERLCAAGHGVESVVQPESTVVAGLEEICAAGGIILRRVGSVHADDFLAVMTACRPELFVVAGFSTIFKRSLFGLPTLGTINLHGGRLPQYRGGSPLNWQMINGDPSVGISIIRLDEGIDTGPVLAEAIIPVGPSDTIADVHGRANRIFPDLVLQSVEALARDPAAGRRQDESKACYWHQRADCDGHIRLTDMTAIEVDRMVRALTRPYPGAYAYLGQSKVRLYKASIADLVLRGLPGRICWIQKRGPYLICADRAVHLEDYLIEGIADGRLRHGDVLQ